MAILNLPEPPISRSVIKQPDLQAAEGFSDFILSIGPVGDSFHPWGTAPRERDRQLRYFWTTEPKLAGAVWIAVSKYASFRWSIDGEAERVVNAYKRLMAAVQNGEGWHGLMTRVLIDYFTQDNGAFIEIIRTDDSPTAPVLSLNHLDSNRCVRTGRFDVPVIYYDSDEKPHRLNWYQVASLTEMPSPIEKYKGMQYCALTRILDEARLRRDELVYRREKASGQYNRKLFIVSGASMKSIDAAIAQQKLTARADGYQRFVQPIAVGSVDPSAKASVAEIDFSELVDSDEDKTMRWYITTLAMIFGMEYQDFAPLSGGSFGTSTQSEVLNSKARGKGPRAFMDAVEHIFNFQGVLPTNIRFQFGEQDLNEDVDLTKLRLLRAEERAMRVKSGEIDLDTARELAVQAGDLDKKYLEKLKGYVPAAPTPTLADSGSGKNPQRASGTGIDRDMQETQPGSQRTKEVAPVQSDFDPVQVNLALVPKARPTRTVQKSVVRDENGRILSVIEKEIEDDGTRS